MKRQTLKNFAIASALLGLMLSAASSMAQGKLPVLKRGRPATSHGSKGTNRPTQALNPGTTSYTTFSYIDFPQSPYTYATGINSGAASSKMLIVGEYGPELLAGFVLQVEGKNGMTYAFDPVAFPKSTNQGAFGVNDLGQIVGEYGTTSATYGYLYSKGKFTTIVVPFTGAVVTEAFDINNSGDIVGPFEYSSGVWQGFLLSGGTYTSLAYPGSNYTIAEALNNNGDIVGYYEDSSGNDHAFLLSGGTYSSIDVPGATLTYASGINDSGDIVGGYCTTSQCASNSDGEQGFLLSGGVFTTINVPAAAATAPIDINNNGVIVGSYSDPGAGLTSTAHSFIAFP
jgi:probable HAF family extracellular repeat protein